MSIASTLPNTAKITDQMAGMPDAALQQMAQMYKQDPYVLPLIVSESQRRQMLRAKAQAQNSMQMGQPPKVVDQAIAAMSPAAQPAPPMPDQASMPSMAQMEQQLPENQGIATLPSAQDTEYAAEGGIMGYAKGGRPDISKLSGSELINLALEMEGVTDPTAISFVKAIHMQESGGKADAATSNKGARGAMQVTPIAFKDVADKDMDYNDTLDRVRAGVRYAMKGLRATGGDPVLSAAYYYGGPYGLSKALKGEAVSDPDNPSYPTTLEYGQAIAQRMAAQKPSKDSTSEASQMSARDAERAALIAQIPGGVQQAPYQEPTFSGNQRVIGGLETLGTLVSGAVSPITGAARSGWQYMTTGKADPIDKSAVETTYHPRTEAGQEMVGSVARAAEDLKLPPYIPALGRVPRRPLPAVVAQADEAAAKVASPRLPAPGATPAAQQAGIAALKADQAAAATKAVPAAIARADDVRLQRITGNANQAIDRAGPAVSTVGMGTQKAGQVTPPVVTPEAPFDDYAVAPTWEPSEKAIIDGAKTVVKETDQKEATSGWDKDDWLNFGLRLMATKSPDFLQAVGEAGTGTVKDRSGRRKAAVEEDYLKARAEESRATAKYTATTKVVASAEDEITKRLNKWLTSSQGILAYSENPMAAAQEEARIRKDVYTQYGLPVQNVVAGAGSTAGFKFMGRVS